MKKIFLLILVLFSLGWGQFPTFKWYNNFVPQEDKYTIINSEIQVYSDALTTKLTEAQKERLDVLVTMLKDSLAIATLATGFDAFFVFANETEEAALRSLVPQDLATVVSAPTWAQWEGYTGDAAASYINTHFNASTDTTVYTQNSASFGIYFRAYGTANKYHGIRNMTMTSLNSSSFNSARINSVNSDNITLTAALGFKMLVRSSSTAYGHYINGAGNTNTETSAAALNLDFYIGAVDTVGGGAQLFDNAQVSVVVMGKVYTATQTLAITNCLEYYMDSLGKGVIP